MEEYSQKELQEITQRALDGAVQYVHDAVGKTVKGTLGFCEAYQKDGHTKVSMHMRLELPNK